jgi:hypothetical protein
MRPFCHFLYLRYLTFSPRVSETTFSLKAAQKIFTSKFNLKLIAEIVFDLRNEFHANRVSFGILESKSFQRQF